jgi:hypothetical protein
VTSPPPPGAVVERSGRVAPLVVLLAVGFLEVGLVTALARSVGGDGSVLLTVLLLPLVVVLGIALVPLVRAVLQPVTQVVSSQGYRRERGGRVEVDLAREQVTAVRFRPASGTTWQATDPDDPSVRGVGRSRLANRIELAGTTTVTLSDGPRWREQVDVLRGWVRERPDLVSDAVTRAFLIEAVAPPPGSPGGDRLPRWPPGLVRLAVRTRDPWAPFLPDAYGEYSALWGGRHTVVRARERGGNLGLLARWFFLLLWFAPVLFLLGMLLWIVVVVVQTRGALDSVPDHHRSHPAVEVVEPRLPRVH